MKEKLRCGVSGLGRIGWRFHLPAIVNTPGMEIAAVADPLTERLDEAAKSYAVPRCFPNWKELADPSFLDLAVIASPTRFHREQAEYFLRRGIDVFCDKPMALSLAEARSMAETARECGRKLMIYQPHRLTGLARRAKEIIASGKLGRIYQIRRSTSAFVRRNDWQAFTSQGGGMLNNYGAHFLDQLLYVGGDRRAEKLRCETARLLSGGDAEDFVTVVMRGASGIMYRLEINMATPVSAPEMEIFGDRGTAVFREGAWHLRFCRELAALRMFPGEAAPAREYPAAEQNFIDEELANPELPPFEWYKYCRDYFNGSAPPLVPLDETLEIMRILEACRASSVEFWG